MAQPVEPTPTAQPVEPTPMAQPVEPTPMAQPVEPTPMAQPVEPTPMAQPVEPTRLPDEATKLIREFAEWLGTTDTNNSREWDKKGDGIYLCIHSQCEEKIRTLKEKLVCPK
jgi:hypothetical protein